MFFIALLAALLGSSASMRKEYFQVSSLSHAAVLGAALACLLHRNLLLGALLLMPLRGFIIYRIDSLEASLSLFGFSMGLAAIFLALSGSTATARTILFGSFWVNDPVAIEALKIFTVVSFIFFYRAYDAIIYEGFDPETAYVYINNLRIYVALYYAFLSFGIVILLRFLGAFLTIVVLSAPEVIFRGLQPRVMPLAYFILLSIIFYISSYTISPTGFATFLLSLIAGVMAIKNLRR